MRDGQKTGTRVEAEEEKGDLLVFTQGLKFSKREGLSVWVQHDD